MEAVEEQEKILEEIKEFATRAHNGQTRKFNEEPYILHPERVMQICSKHTSDLSILGASLLHDVLEDTSITKEQLRAFLDKIAGSDVQQKTMGLVEEMTDVYTKEHYPQLNREERKSMESKRIALTSGASQTIRYADIIDNCRGMGQEDTEFAHLFLSECEALLHLIDKGDKSLYTEAKQTVSEALNELNHIQK